MVLFPFLPLIVMRLWGYSELTMEVGMQSLSAEIRMQPTSERCGEKIQKKIT
jgi:hypothetical protein